MECGSNDKGMTMAAAQRNRCVTITGPRQIAALDGPVPAPGPGEVLIRTAYSGISAGTELNVYRGIAPQWRHRQDEGSGLFLDDVPEWTYPLAYGYANVGHVAAVGDGVGAVRKAISCSPTAALRLGRRRGRGGRRAPRAGRPAAGRVRRERQHGVQRRARRPPIARRRRRRDGTGDHRAHRHRACCAAPGAASSSGSTRSSSGAGAPWRPAPIACLRPRTTWPGSCAS